MASPSLISATWFPAGQRTTATSIVILSGNVGFALGFVIGGWVSALIIGMGLDRNCPREENVKKTWRCFRNYSICCKFVELHSTNSED